MPYESNARNPLRRVDASTVVLSDDARLNELKKKTKQKESRIFVDTNDRWSPTLKSDRITPIAAMANPRKFSEKIALHNQKQAEETAAFEKIMREVSVATNVKVGFRYERFVIVGGNKSCKCLRCPH